MSTAGAGSGFTGSVKKLNSRAAEFHMEEFLIVFQPSGRRGMVERGSTLTEAARLVGEGLESLCGGKATCGKCQVVIEEGEFAKYGIHSESSHVSPLSEAERSVLEKRGAPAGRRLGCVATVQGDLVVFIPEETRLAKQVVRKSAASRSIPLKPAVRKYFVELAPPSLEDPLGDWERLTAELSARFHLEGLEIDYPALRGLQKTLRDGEWRATVSIWMGKEIISVEPGLFEQSIGLAVDIGTTTIAAYLCDLENGRVLAASSLMNPQLAFGEDVISRISFIQSNPDGLERLNQAVIEAVNRLAEQAAAQVGLQPVDILEAVMVGNTAMHHILLNLDTAYLGIAPFSPARHQSINIKARSLGLNFHPGANVYILPVEAGFVGADNVGVLIAEEPYNQDENWLIIDVGTNGEIVLGNREKLYCASCACGPALEGGQIRFGMRAAPGAIERVRINPETLEPRYQVIGRSEWNDELEPQQVQARGICGSGIIDAVAEMFAAGLIQKNSRLKAPGSHPRLRQGEHGTEYVLAWAEETTSGRDITLSQHDLQAITLAKAAIYSGCKVLLSRADLERPDKIILAGGFGSLIDKERAMAIGLFPACPPEDVYSVGNAAGDGARFALLNIDKRREADIIARQVEHVELTLEGSFEDEYICAMYYPHKRDLPQVEQ
jgi:uncharacterized 2Fe-2S/4Fe-4S cluster protein (DUF4445 family)